MRVYSQSELSEILQRHRDDARYRRNLDCMAYSFVGFLAAAIAGYLAYSIGLLP